MLVLGETSRAALQALLLLGSCWCTFVEAAVHTDQFSLGNLCRSLCVLPLRGWRGSKTCSLPSIGSQSLKDIIAQVSVLTTCRGHLVGMGLASGLPRALFTYIILNSLISSLRWILLSPVYRWGSSIFPPACYHAASQHNVLNPLPRT